MAEKLTHEEFDRRVREAMRGQSAGQNFSPAIQKLRQTVKSRKPGTRLPMMAS